MRGRSPSGRQVPVFSYLYTEYNIMLDDNIKHVGTTYLMELLQTIITYSMAGKSVDEIMAEVRRRLQFAEDNGVTL